MERQARRTWPEPGRPVCGGPLDEGADRRQSDRRCSGWSGTAALPPTATRLNDDVATPAAQPAIAPGDRSGSRQAGAVPRQVSPGLLQHLQSVPRLVANLNRRLGGRLSAEDLHDVAHDAIVIAIRKFHRLPPNVPVAAWLCKLCSFELRNAIRRKQREATLRAAGPEELAHDDLLVQLERQELVMMAFQRLQAPEAEVVRMYYIEGHTFSEIAMALGITENTVKGRCYRAIDRLTAAWQRSSPQDQP